VGEEVLLEVYGMTETAPLTTMNPAAGKKKLGSIGLPLVNTELKLCDPGTGEPVPLGEAGEICVRGPQVMVGYYKKPDETARAVDKDGWMHTGDVAVMDEEGYLRIVDRTKDMIIVSGFKVFSKKVEEVLAEHSAVEMIATVGTPNPERPGSELVKAYIQRPAGYTWEGGEEALKAEITRFAKQKLAPYEVPKAIEFIDEMPLTSVGKIDKKQLRKKKV
jgi:long-chain acyl-CoA synthetase